MSIIKKVKKSTKLAVMSVSLIVGQMLLAHSSMAQKVEIPERIAKYQADKLTPQEVESMDRAPSANPWLSFRPEGEIVDWNYWRIKQAMYAKNNKNTAAFSARSAKSMTMAPGATKLVLLDLSSDSVATGSVVIDGEFVFPEPAPLAPFAEDEGAIPLATEVSVQAGGAVVVESEIGDGDFGSTGTGSGDIDFYVLRDVLAGQIITVEVATPSPFGDLDPYVEIYDSNGAFLAENDDGNPLESFDSFLSFQASADGDYYISIAGYGTFFLSDPFDSSSGLGSIFGRPLSEGVYTATIGLEYIDRQSIVFEGSPGDVFGAAIDGTAAYMSLRDSYNVERQGSSQDLRFIMPDNSPLPAGLVSVNHVVDQSGSYTLELTSAMAGAYELTLELSLPPLAADGGDHVQTIFLDFDGETVDLSESIAPGAPPGVLIAELSPMSAFLENWGLGPYMETYLIDKIVRVVERNLGYDIDTLGGNARFDIEILNSRDHEDPFGEPNVSRVIVGGTIQELGASTIGIAQSIDVGNFDTEETAFVLLDVLSDLNPLNPNSVNGYSFDADVDKFELVGTAVGEIISHEIGHYLGNWHTDQFNDSPNIMDQGGNLINSIVGAGADGIYGTADDVDVRFGLDAYVPSEGLSGFENTLTTIAWGATTPELEVIFNMLRD